MAKSFVNRRDFSGESNDKVTMMFKKDEVLKVKDKNLYNVGITVAQDQMENPKGQDSLTFQPNAKSYPNKKGRISYADKTEIGKKTLDDILENGTEFEVDGTSYVGFTADVQFQNYDKDAKKKVPKKPWEHYHLTNVGKLDRRIDIEAHEEKTKAAREANKEARAEKAKEAEAADKEEQIEV